MKSVIFLTIVATAILRASGRASLTRVIGGANASEGQFPYQVLLYLKIDENSLMMGVCGGSIINNRWILTAAHCLDFDGERASVGTVLVGTVSASQGGKKYEADLFLPHEDYDAQRVINDIALVRVNEDIEFNDKVQSIELAQTDETQAGDIFTVSGWGRTEPDSAEHPDRLQYLDLEIISKESCKKYHSNILDSQICVQSPSGVGSCMGDSGGPLANRDDNIQVGVVSFAIGNCANGKPNVLTKVSSFVDWINEQIEENTKTTMYDDFW